MSNVIYSAQKADFIAYKDNKFFASLDGLRFICITAVIFHHSPWKEVLQNSYLLASRGFLGVDFFFVLSGYLITTLLLREEQRAGRFSLKGFYKRRALRILPVYFLVITLVGGYYVFVRGDAAAADIWIYYYLFLSNFLINDIPTLSITWSLSVEEQYYMIWPLLLLLAPRKIVPGLLVVLIVLNVAIAEGVFAPLGVTPYETEHLRFALPAATYAPILIGTLLGFALNAPTGFAWVNKIAGFRLAPLAGLGMLGLFLVVLPQDIRGLPNLVIHVCMAYVLASVVVAEKNILRPVLTLAPIKRIGQISYGVYLYHLIALDVVSRVGPDWVSERPAAVFVIYYLVAVLIAEISFRYYEMPFLRKRHAVPSTSSPTAR